MKKSPYLHWVKQRFGGARYNLARSGVETLPLERLAPSLGDVLAEEPHGDGWPPLIARIAGRYGVGEDCVAVAHGTSMANHLACAALLEPGDEVVLESPAYEPIESLVRYLRATLRTVARRAENAWALDVDAIARAMTPRTRLVIATNLHNPTGAHTDGAALAALSALADAHRCHVLIDEVYLEFLYLEGERTAAPISPWFVTTRSLTKAYGLGSLRIGWVIAEPGLAERVRRLHDLFAAELSHPAERLAALALDRADALLGPTFERLREHIAVVDAFVAAQPRLSWVAPRAGTVGFVRLRGGSVDDLAATLSDRYDTLVSPGRFFGAPDHFRLGWGFDRATLEEGLRRLSSAL
jgi:hypothetical protein